MVNRSVPSNKQVQREAKSDGFLGSLVTILDPASAASEAYRTLRTSLFYTLVDTPPKSVVVTSPHRKEGKTTTCANLGVVLAQADKSTLIIDCDLRKPEIHKMFGLRNDRGVVNALADEHDLSEVWQEPLPRLPVLKVVTTGLLPLNPAELLSSRRFADLLDQMREAFDYVLIDTPPVQLVSDPMVLASQADGVLLVLNAQKTRKGSVRKATRSLEAVGANLLGTVMNNAKGRKSSLYGNVYGR